MRTSIHTGKKDDVGPTGLCAVSGGSHDVLATSGRDGMVKVWDVRTQGEGPVSTFFTGMLDTAVCCFIGVSWKCVFLA